MSLNWNIEKCNFEEGFKEKNWPAIEAMIWFTIVIDIGEIKKDNLEEIEFRLRAWSTITNRLTTNESVEEVVKILPKLVGLATNVITTKRKIFNAKLINQLEYEVNQTIKFNKEEMLLKGE